MFNLDKMDTDLATKLNAYWSVQRAILAAATAPQPAAPSLGASQTEQDPQEQVLQVVQHGPTEQEQQQQQQQQQAKPLEQQGSAGNSDSDDGSSSESSSDDDDNIVSDDDQQEHDGAGKAMPAVKHAIMTDADRLRLATSLSG